MELPKNYLLFGVKKISNLTINQKINNYLYKYGLNKILDLKKELDSKELNLKNKDNISLFQYIYYNFSFKISKFTKDLNIKIIYKEFDEYFKKINNLINNNKKYLTFYSLKKIDNDLIDEKINDKNINNFIKYLNNNNFENFEIIIYFYDDFFYFNFFFDINNNTVKKFSYNQIESNFYKMLLVLTKSNEIIVYDDNLYNNMLSFYINYFINNTLNNVIILKNNNKLEVYNLIDSEDSLFDLSIDIKKNSIINAYNNYTGNYYSNYIDYYLKKKLDLYRNGKKNEIARKIIVQKGGIFGFGEKGNKKKKFKPVEVKKKDLKKFRFDLLNYILFDFKNDKKNNFKKYTNELSDNSDKFNAIILNYDLIKNKNEENKIPSLQFNFLNEINKTVEEIDKDYKIEKNINIDKDIKEIISKNIFLEINESFLREINENLNFINISNIIDLNYDNSVKLDSNIMKVYLNDSKNNKKNKNIKLLNDFIKLNKNYSYLIKIEYLSDKNYDLSYKINLNLNIDGLDKLKIKRKVMTFINRNLKNLKINFQKFLSKNKKLNEFFKNLITEKSKINILINNNNLYIVVIKNSNFIIFDTFNIVNIFNFSKNCESVFYETIYNLDFINFYRNNNDFEKLTELNFDSLLNIYNNQYCKLNNFFQDNNINEINLFFKSGLTYFENNNYEKYDDFFYNFNIYNRDFYNFFSKYRDFKIKIITKEKLLYIQLNQGPLKKEIEFNLYRSLLISNSFNSVNIFNINNTKKNIKELNNSNYPIYDIENIKKINFNIISKSNEKMIKMKDNLKENNFQNNNFNENNENNKNMNTSLLPSQENIKKAIETVRNEVLQNSSKIVQK